jgi:hypothetical protein
MRWMQLTAGSVAWVLGAWAFAPSPGAADPIADFYRGKDPEHGRRYVAGR